MSAYYNEIDPKAAAFLRSCGHCKASYSPITQIACLRAEINRLNRAIHTEGNRVQTLIAEEVIEAVSRTVRTCIDMADPHTTKRIQRRFKLSETLPTPALDWTELDRDHQGFILRVRTGGGCKHSAEPHYSADGIPLWEKAEKSGFIQCTGSYKWLVTDKFLKLVPPTP